MNLQNLEKQKKKVEAQLLEFNRKISEEKKDKFVWMKIPEMEIEIQTQIHHKGKSYDDLVKEFGKEYLEENLPTYAQLQFLRNSEKYIDKLGLLKTWEFVKQEDEISKKNGYVAGFVAYSGCAYLDCVGDSGDSYSSLGVRFARKISRAKKSKSN